MPTVERTGSATIGVVLEPLGQVAPGQAPKPTVLLSMYHALQRLIFTVNGRLTLGDAQDGAHTGSFDGQYRKLKTPPVANTPFAVPHGMARLPVGYWVVRSDKAVLVYDDPQNAHTRDVLWLAANVADAVITLAIVPSPN